MQNINDDDLILFYYRDGLDATRLAQIGQALQDSPELAARYGRLTALLDAADEVPPQPDAGFEARVWANLEARIAPAKVIPIASRRRAAPVLRWVGFAAAAALVLAAGFFAGRQSVPPPPAVAEKDGSSGRVLDAYVAAHLRQTEGLILTAVNSDSAELRHGDAELAAALVDSNRLYAAAATRAGNTRLADFLRQLEPLLLELANPASAPDISVRQGLRDYVRSNDVLFQVRATEARLDARGVRGT
jgi:hypothetical protein